MRLHTCLTGLSSRRKYYLGGLGGAGHAHLTPTTPSLPPAGSLQGLVHAGAVCVPAGESSAEALVTALWWWSIMEALSLAAVKLVWGLSPVSPGLPLPVVIGPWKWLGWARGAILHAILKVSNTFRSVNTFMLSLHCYLHTYQCLSGHSEFRHTLSVNFGNKSESHFCFLHSSEFAPAWENLEGSSADTATRPRGDTPTQRMSLGWKCGQDHQGQML